MGLTDGALRSCLDGFTPRVVVNGLISTGKEQQVQFPRGQLWDWHFQHLCQETYKFCCTDFTTIAIKLFKSKQDTCQTVKTLKKKLFFKFKSVATCPPCRLTINKHKNKKSRSLLGNTSYPSAHPLAGRKNSPLLTNPNSLLPKYRM